MEIIDTHSHLFVEEFRSDLPDVIARAKAAGVSRVFMPNIDADTIKPLFEVTHQYKGFCYPMMGLHPTSVDKDFKSQLEVIRKSLVEHQEEVVAIGEVGLDLYWDKTYLSEQIEALKIQIEWALEFDLPLVLHTRSAYPELLEVLESYKSTSLRGVFHSFTSTKEELAQLLPFTNFLVGINGVVTFKNSTLRHFLTDLPLERLVLETDSPYLAPVPHRGRRNESAYVEEVLKAVAEIYEKPLEEVACRTTKSALNLFGILQ